ncbi:hypothetical protein AJ80_08046 [Polytolypa hystricis UAMH7299]|uniref:Uncharacterized protein n=1 Tax=Polytolypa hystricis (strain UAMH7299) TaxID=1447883 RepID=A0A2B7XDW3_POLH7|nr:hypothetical protein AJ80_08046 [Polytolypa hystricis UAMH7299]
MAMQYVNYIKGKARFSKPPKEQVPVLTDADEEFLNRLTASAEAASESTSTAVGQDAQLALMDGAQDIPLPQSPTGQAPTRELSAGDGGLEEKGEGKQGEKSPKAKNFRPWSWIRESGDKWRRENTAAGLSNIVHGLKAPDAKADEGEEAKKEEEDLEDVLESLNLAAVNNRVFSFSDETQELLRKFKLIFKDLINGVPTAYNDLEKLLTNGDGQLQKSFDSMPTFLKKLVEHLPDKVTEHLTPELLAAAAEKTESGKKLGLKVPSLKEMVAKPAALAGLLRSIIAFLRTKFPAVMGMNVLWSLALFVLLFVLWYCYKRGRDVRLEKERLLTEQEIAKLNIEYASLIASEALTTTAPEDAPIEEVEAGVREVQHARQAALTKAARTPSASASEAVDETRRSKLEPYPGT